MHQPRVSLLRAAVLCAVATTCAHANDGLDTSWNGSGTLVMPVQNNKVELATMALQPNGRVLLAGSCYGANDKTFPCMTRLLPDGVRDFSFGPNQNGVFAFSEFPSYPDGTDMALHGLLLQADGRIVVAGAAYDSTSHAFKLALTRLLPNGTLDTSVPMQPATFEFAHNALNPQNYPAAAALQADGKVVIAGYTNRPDTDPPNTDFAVARLRTDLTLDPSFNGAGAKPGVVTAAFDLGGDNFDTVIGMAIQPDGKIVLAGTVDTANEGSDAALLRLNADGTPDATFGNNGRAWFNFGGHQGDDVILTTKLDAAGHIYIAGQYQWSGTDTDFLVARVRANGTLDTDFCGGTLHPGYTTVAFDLDENTTSTMTDAVWSMLLQSDGKIMLAGSASNGAANGKGFDFATARLLPNCQLDTTFGANGTLTGKFANSMPVNHGMVTASGGSGIVFGGVAENVDADGYTTEGQFGVAMIGINEIFANGFDMP